MSLHAGQAKRLLHGQIIITKVTLERAPTAKGSRSAFQREIIYDNRKVNDTNFQSESFYVMLCVSREIQQYIVEYEKRIVGSSFHDSIVY